MLTVHHLNNSRSQRVLWLLEELGVPYRIQHHQRNSKTMLAPPELRQIHPLGKSPVLTDDAITVAESGAIVEYLLEKYGEGRFAPKPGTAEHLRTRYWMHYAEGSIMPLLVMKLIFSVVPRHAPFLIRPIAKALFGGVEKNFLGPNLKTHLAFIESELAHGPYFGGAEPTAADFQMIFPLEAALARGSNDAYPKMRAYVDRVHSRPAYQRALQKGGPYELLS